MQKGSKVKSGKPVLDLPERYLSTLLGLLERYVPGAEVWAYGSRVSGEAHEGSDLDLVLRNPAGLEKPVSNLSALMGALKESDLPIVVDVVDWAEIPETFRDEIERGYVMVKGGVLRALIP